MNIDFEFCLPDTVPGMTLQDVVLFPQATLPLFIFEPRYRKMLEDSLEGDRLILIATQDEELAKKSDEFEPYHQTATLGMIQSSQKNEDGTSSILLQGLLRVKIVDTLQEEPYRLFAIEPIPTEPGLDALAMEKKMEQLLALIHQRSKLGNRISKEILRFLDNIDDADILTDIVSFTLIHTTDFKLRLLQTPTIEKRLQYLMQWFQAEIQHLTLVDQLQGNLMDDRISLN